MSTTKSPIKFHIKQWAIQEHGLIDTFVDEWTNANADDPEQWPMELTAGQWDEQYWAFHHDCDEKPPEES